VATLEEFGQKLLSNSYILLYCFHMPSRYAFAKYSYGYYKRRGIIMRVVLLALIKCIVVVSFAILGFNAGALVAALIPQCKVYIVRVIVSISFGICGLIVTKGVNR